MRNAYDLGVCATLCGMVVRCRAGASVVVSDSKEAFMSV